jgi:hypothetical protein
MRTGKVCIFAVRDRRLGKGTRRVSALENNLCNATAALHELARSTGSGSDNRISDNHPRAVMTKALELTTLQGPWPHAWNLA